MQYFQVRMNMNVLVRISESLSIPFFYYFVSSPNDEQQNLKYKNYLFCCPLMNKKITNNQFRLFGLIWAANIYFNTKLWHFMGYCNYGRKGYYVSCSYFPSLSQDLQIEEFSLHVSMLKKISTIREIFSSALQRLPYSPSQLQQTIISIILLDFLKKRTKV